jgi:hypothetical protein
MELQMLLSVTDLTNNQALVYISPDSTRVRIEPTLRFILEAWTLGMKLDHRAANIDISPPVTYKHGIILFRSLFSLLRVPPLWKFCKRIKKGWQEWTPWYNCESGHLVEAWRVYVDLVSHSFSKRLFLVRVHLY